MRGSDGSLDMTYNSQKQIIVRKNKKSKHYSTPTEGMTVDGDDETGLLLDQDTFD